jgi:hypothetical protein
MLSQRRLHREGRLGTDKWVRLTFLEESLLEGKKQFGSTKSKRGAGVEAILATLPPPELNSAAACLLQMSRTDASTPNDLIEDDDDDEDCEPVPVVAAITPAIKEAVVMEEEPVVEEAVLTELNHKKLNFITFPFCDTCKAGKSCSSKKKKNHHEMCPKNPECNRVKLGKIVLGYNAGCACCKREFELGPKRGRHEAHSNYCPRSTKFKEGSKRKRLPTCPVPKVTPALVTPKSLVIKNTPSTKKNKNKMKAKPVPDKVFLPDMFMDNHSVPPPPLLFKKSVEIIPLPHEISPLITVDTYDLDALIGDLEQGTASSEDALERLQKIRRTAL